MPHQASHIGRLAERRIPNDVQIREARKAERFPDPVPAGFLDVERNSVVPLTRTPVSSVSTREEASCASGERLFGPW